MLQQGSRVYSIQRRIGWALRPGVFCTAAAVALLLLPFGVACDGTNPLWPFPQTSSARLDKFLSRDSLRAYLGDQHQQAIRLRNSRSAPLQILFPFVNNPFLAANAGAPSASPSGGDAGHSTTNVQESGVDESDIIKTDGDFFYIARQNAEGASTLKIVTADPADMRVISSTALPPGRNRLYLLGDRLVVVSQMYANTSRFDGMSVSTEITLLDIADRAAPQLIKAWGFEAGLNESRMIQSKLHLVLAAQPVFDFPEILPIEFVDLDAILPDMATRSGDGGVARENIADWSDFYRPEDPDGFGLITVMTLDMNALDEPPKKAVVVANASTVYSSTEALYVANNDYNYFGDRRTSTDIHKFALTEAGPVPSGSANVPGRLLNRYSLGEYEGNLRVATTVGHVSRDGSSQVYNNVYVLSEQSEELAVVGSVENIAPGEQIYSARFIGARGYMVTFKKVDPLFTLDLSEPTSPRIVGELKIPGYSDYLHPLDENHLLGIGKDAVDAGTFAWYQGVQLSVFDVTDFANPQRIDAEIVGVRGTESEAAREPHAFNYYAPAAMLAIPIRLYENAGPDPYSFGDYEETGLFLYHVSPETGIEPAGRITTDSGTSDSRYNYGRPQWMRSAFINDHVYAITNDAVRAAPFADMDVDPDILSLE